MCKILNLFFIMHSLRVKIEWGGDKGKSVRLTYFDVKSNGRNANVGYSQPPLRMLKLISSL